MPRRDVIVVGASAGGVEALRALVARLPGNLAAAIFVVLHIPPSVPSALPRILSSAGSLPAHHPEDGEPIEPGHIYVAPPDYHLLVYPGRVRLWRGPRVNRARPAVDTLFNSAARAYGSRVIGVVLSGALDDGSAGLALIKSVDGLAVVQHPRDALVASMPESALKAVPEMDFCLATPQLGPTLTRIVSESKGAEKGEMTVPPMEEHEPNLPDLYAAVDTSAERQAPSGIACPECGGALWERTDNNVVQYACYLGHVYSLENMVVAQREALEIALWSAIRTLEERGALLHRMAHRSEGIGKLAARYTQESGELAEHARLLRSLLERPPETD